MRSSSDARSIALGIAVLVERDAEMVDAGPVPMTRLEDDIHGTTRQLDEPKPEAFLLELLPRDAGLEPE